MIKKKLLIILISGSKNIRFTDAISCAESFGFKLDRINGSHHIYVHRKVTELLNLQNVNGKSKPYQVKQMMQIIEKYNLRLGEK